MTDSEFEVKWNQGALRRWAVEHAISYYGTVVRPAAEVVQFASEIEQYVLNGRLKAE